jgi:ADP-ribose pyrophosphatase
VEHGGAAAIVPILDDDSVVLVKQFRYALGKVLVEVPAGKLEQDESPEECAKRELLEETGYDAGRLEKLFQCYLAPGYSNELIHIFLASELKKRRQRTGPEETIRIFKVKIEDALHMIRIGEIEDAKSICGLLAVATRCMKG